MNRLASLIIKALISYMAVFLLALVLFLAVYALVVGRYPMPEKMIASFVVVGLLMVAVATAIDVMHQIEAKK